MFDKTAKMPSKAEALPGRAERMPVPADAPRATAHGSRRRFPPGWRRRMFGLGCFWGAEKKFWQLPGVYTTAVGYAAGHTPNPTYREVCSGMTGHNEVVLVVFDPKKISYDELLKVFWESHDPTQGMRQGNDVGTQYRSGIYYYDDAQRAGGGAHARRLPAAADAGRLRRDHDRDPSGAGVLLRRGLPPAVPRKEPGRLLRSRRHRRRLPGRARGPITPIIQRPTSKNS